MIKVIPLGLALILSLSACSTEQAPPEAPPAEDPAEPVAPPTDPTEPTDPPAVPVAPNPPSTPGTPPDPTPPEETEFALTLSAEVTEGEAPLTVEFTAAANQDVIGYEWYVDNFYLEWDEAQLSYTFAEPGTFDVLVAALNENLEVAVDVVSVTVTEPAPPETPVEPPTDPVEPPEEPVDPPEEPVQPEPPADPPVEPEQGS